MDVTGLKKNELKRITDLNVKCRTRNFLDSNVGKTHTTRDLAMTFSIRHHSVKEIVDKLEFTTIKDVNSAEDTVNGERSRATVWKEYL